MKHKNPFILIISLMLSLVIVLTAVLVYVVFQDAQVKSTFKSNDSEKTTDINEAISGVEPKLQTEVLIDKLKVSWDLSFLNDNVFVFTQRYGELRGFNLNTRENWSIVRPADIYARGEGGMMGVKADIDFATNRYVYVCTNVNGPSISVLRFQLSSDFKSVENRKDIITGMPSNTSGRHSGCRMTMDKKGQLWVGTGDTAQGTTPQDPKSLGGKILRVDRDGNGVEGNLGAPFDTRIFSYGHRNTQGIVLFDEEINGVFGLSAEHGSSIDDEINLIKQGNFGWDPIPTILNPVYNEIGTSMTDKNKFPDAIDSIWSSGSSTIAPSGITIIKGIQWKSWNGAVLTAVLKDMHVMLQKYDKDYKITRQEKVLTQFGRVRTVLQGPDGNLYLTTDNWNDDDKIIKISVIGN